MAVPTYETRLRHIYENPEQHRHDFEGLLRCCLNEDAMDTGLMEAHEGIYGTNGGRKCDVSTGPCSCGAWH